MGMCRHIAALCWRFCCMQGWAAWDLQPCTQFCSAESLMAMCHNTFSFVAECCLLLLSALTAGLAQESVRDVVGQLLYFALLLLLSFATIIICIAKTVQGGRLHSRFLLPAAWALYNAVGPVLFFCAATLKKSKSLELAMYLLSMVSAEQGCYCACQVSCWVVFFLVLLIV